MKKSSKKVQDIFEELLEMEISAVHTVNGIPEMPHYDEFFVVISGEVGFEVKTGLNSEKITLGATELFIPRHSAVLVGEGMAGNRLISIRILPRIIFLTVFENSKPVDGLMISCLREYTPEVFQVVEQLRRGEGLLRQDLWLLGGFRQLLVLIYQILVEPESMGTGFLWSGRDRLAGIIAHYLGNNLDQKLLREDVAQKFSYTGNSLNLLMKEKYGQSFRQYLLWIRMERALRLLRTNSLKIKEVSRLCGFEHVEHFVALFRKNFGLTPLKYRQAITGDLSKIFQMKSLQNCPEISLIPVKGDDAVPVSAGGGRTGFTLFNSTDKNYELFWVNFDGDCEFFYLLEPRSIQCFRSYLGHAWLVREVNSNNAYVLRVDVENGLCQLNV